MHLLTSVIQLTSVSWCLGSLCGHYLLSYNISYMALVWSDLPNEVWLPIRADEEAANLQQPKAFWDYVGVLKVVRTRSHPQLRERMGEKRLQAHQRTSHVPTLSWLISVSSACACPQRRNARTFFTNIPHTGWKLQQVTPFPPPWNVFLIVK